MPLSWWRGSADAKPQPGDAVSAEEEIRHPHVLEFLGLRDDYSETNLEDGLNGTFPG